MEKIKHVEYKNGDTIKECVVTFVNGHKQVFRTLQEIQEVQKELARQQQQFLVE